MYNDAVEALQLLKAEGMVTGGCSNQAARYGPVLRHLLSDMDGFALSYEVGVMKPHERIYREICHQLGIRLGSDLTALGDKVVMVGDSLQCDRIGPRAVGICGHYLDRAWAGSLSDLVPEPHGAGENHHSTLIAHTFLLRLSKKVVLSVAAQSIGSSSVQLSASSNVTRPSPYAFPRVDSTHRPAQ